MSVPLRSCVALIYVKNVAESIQFYRKIGFDIGNSFTPENEPETTWAWLHSDGAQLMIAKATEPVIASQQAVLFYIYCDDVVAKRNELEQLGLNIGPMKYPFYCPKGEFRVTDPDGFVLMITHT